MSDSSIKPLLSEISSRVDGILETSFPLCENQNLTVANNCAKINDSAHEIKKLLSYIESVLNNTKST